MNKTNTNFNDLFDVDYQTGIVRIKGTDTVVPSLRYDQKLGEIRSYGVKTFEKRSADVIHTDTNTDSGDNDEFLAALLFGDDDTTGLEELRTEEWFDLFGYDFYKDTYQISNKGRLMNIKTGRILKPFTLWKSNGKGYYAYDLCKDGVRKKSVSAHRLVALACVYNDDPEHKTVVHHIDGDPTNNRSDNLVWLTPQEHMEIHKAITVEMCNPDTMEVIQTFPSVMEAARVTGFSQGAICDACRGKFHGKHIYKGFYWRYKQD